MLAALYFAFAPHFWEAGKLKTEPGLLFESLNTALIFMGLGASFSSLQDTTKTQNKLSKKIWENPIKGKIMLIVLFLWILTLLAWGLIGYFNNEGMLKELSIGIIVLSLGLFGFLKTAVEMFENHRKDKLHKNR